MQFVRFASVFLLALAACTQQEETLEGERLALDGTPVAEAQAPSGPPPAFALPAASTNTLWTHRAGTPGQRVEHVALDLPLTPVWEARIGDGNSRRHRITAIPVVADGRIFTLDSRARVAAFDADGRLLWSRDLTPDGEDPADASGGGLAVAGARLFVTSAFGSLSALDAATGEVIWTQALGSAASGAPAAADGKVFVVDGDSVGWAIDAETGRVLWTVLGPPAGASFTGGAAPLVTSRLVVFPFPSGALIATFKDEGFQVWTGSAVGARPDSPISRISSISADPVPVGADVVTANVSGITVMLDGRTGDRVWAADEGALGPIWVAGDSLFQISDRNALLRLDRKTGRVLWSTELPNFVARREKQRAAIYAHYGPVLAGGSLIVASGDGKFRFFDPATGEETGEASLPGGAAAQPVVADGTLYVVTGDGLLRAFR